MNSTEKPTTYNKQSAEWTAAAIALLVHGSVLFVLMFIALQEPEKQTDDREIEIVLTEPSPPEPAQQTDIDANPSSQRSSRNETGSAPTKPGYSVESRSDDIVLENLPIVRKPEIATPKPWESLADTMTQEEAYKELMALLEEHPEFKETIIGMMLAGEHSNEAPDLFRSTGLEEILANQRWKDGYEYEARKNQRYFGPYDPVHGLNSGQYGGQINVIGLYKFLRKLIDGDL